MLHQPYNVIKEPGFACNNLFSDTLTLTNFENIFRTDKNQTFPPVIYHTTNLGTIFLKDHHSKKKNPGSYPQTYIWPPFSNICHVSSMFCFSRCCTYTLSCPSLEKARWRRVRVPSLVYSSSSSSYR